MKIALVSTNDTLGGAATVTLRLMEALRAQGEDARMVVAREYGGANGEAQPYILNAGRKMRQRGAFLAERAEIFARNGFDRKNLFKVSTARFGIDLTRHAFIRQADVIVLNWVCQGFMSLKGLEKLCQLGKPIVWVMHDLWCATGICHIPGQCQRYITDGCSDCPYASQLAKETFRRKKQIFSRYPIHFVAVSRWQKEQAEASPLLQGRKIEVVPHAFPTEQYTVAPPAGFSLAGVDRGKKLIVMGAARLDDPVKGLPQAVEALNVFAGRYSEEASRCQAVFFGGLRDPQALDGIRMAHAHVGQLSGEALRGLYSSAITVMCTSQYETMGATLMEGMASGAVPVSFDRGGQADIVTHLKNGYLAPYGDCSAFAEGLHWALGHSAPGRQTQHASVAERFGADVIAERYRRMFDGLLQAGA